MAKQNRLTASFVRSVRKPGRHSDGRGSRGLALLVQADAAGQIRKSWIQRIKVDGRVTNKGLGGYPSTTLTQARSKAIRNWLQVQDGKSPFTKRVPTFAVCADRCIRELVPTWKSGSRSEDIWRRSLDAYVMPVIGDIRINEITAKRLHDLLTPIWTAKRATGLKIMQRISTIMQWAQVQGYRKDDPTTALRPPRNGQVKHFDALPHGEVKAAVQAIRRCKQWDAAKAAVEFAIFTAARSAEVCGATWDEIDLDAGTWTIPAARTKVKRDHVVPLNDGAKWALTEVIGRHPTLVFPSAQGKVMNGLILRRVLQAAGVESTVHGFRSSFRDWCGETGQPREVAEASLAHVVGSAVEQAYARSTMLARRRELMKAWSDYLL
ncbi:MAG: tyrosine-type recombinase/integrase [Bryobacterales bacterium]|nr:tyrosine-type recombinase/integrase [Bryobacterales bacterium]MDE0293693.1 tyrosine-type recombinase/integrase [Bryobacterales bacterium]